jgi:hypothetical protein
MGKGLKRATDEVKREFENTERELLAPVASVQHV